MASKMRDILVVILVLAVVIFGFIAIFRPGPTGKWTIKFRGLETKGSNVALTFAVLLAVVVLLHPGLRKALKKSFMEAFWHRWTLIVLLVYLLVATLLWPLGYRQLSDRTPLYYLLSAQAQVLSAIVALVFTTTVVVAQLASRYSQRILHQVLGSWALWYLVPYLIGMIHPLLLLNRDFSLREAQISLLICGFCLVFLIPYYITLRGHLALDTVIRNMVPERLRKGRQDFRAGRRPKHDIFNSIYNLESYAMGAYGNYDQETFEQALKALRKVGAALITKVAREQDASARQELLEKLKNLLCYRLGYMARWTLGHPRAPFVFIGLLRELGIKAVETAQGRLAHEFIKTLLKVGNDALHRGIRDTASYAVGAVGRIATRAVERQLWEFVRYEEGAWIVKGLTNIGQTAAQKSMDEVVRMVSTVLWKVATTAIDVASLHIDDQTRSHAQRVTGKFSEAMGRVGRVAIGTVSDEVILRIVGHLAHSKKSGGEPTNIGVKAIRADLGYAVRVVIRSLKGVYKKADLGRNRHRVASSVIIAFGRLAEELANRKEAGSMDHWVNACVKTLVNFLCEVAQDVATNWTDANDEKWLELGEAVAASLGYATQSAITVGNYDDAKKGVKALEALVQKVEGLVGSSGTFPPAWWEEGGICWRLATSLRFISSRAAEKGLGEILEATIPLLNRIGEAARQAGGFTTVIAVVEAARHITEALTKTYGAVNVPGLP
jgi:hypothetical protein